MDSFVAPCPIIALLSSTNVLQLASFLDSQKDFTPSIVSQPVRIEMGAMKSSVERITDKATVSSDMKASGSSAGQPPIPSIAPSAFSFGPAATTTTGSSVSVSALALNFGGSGASQPPIPSKAPGVFSFGAAAA